MGGDREYTQAYERKIQRLSECYGGGLFQFVYEAGPCGYGLYRQLLASDHDAQVVVAPSRIPKEPAERKARQQLNAFVLRHGHHWPKAKSRWTQTHFNWLESLRFEPHRQQVVLLEYVEAMKAESRWVADMTTQMERALPQFPGASRGGLVALRGIDKVVPWSWATRI